MKATQLVISMVFLCITLASSLKIAGTLGYYAIFTDNFIENFCENKSRPVLKCDGKCVLSQMLLQEAAENEEPINIDFLKTETILFLDGVLEMEFPTLFTNVDFDLWYSNNYHFDLLDRIIHPPRI